MTFSLNPVALIALEFDQSLSFNYKRYRDLLTFM